MWLPAVAPTDYGKKVAIFYTLIKIRACNVKGRQRHDYVLEFLSAFKNGAQVCPKTSVHGHCDPLSDWAYQMVICVPPPHDMPDLTTDVLKPLPEHTEILPELQIADIQNNSAKPVVGNLSMPRQQVTSILPSATRQPVKKY